MSENHCRGRGRAVLSREDKSCCVLQNPYRPQRQRVLSHNGLSRNGNGQSRREGALDLKVQLLFVPFTTSFFPSSPLLVSMRSPVRSARIREGAAPQGMQCAHRNQRGYASKPELREATQRPRRQIPKNQQKKPPNGIRQNDNINWELTGQSVSNSILSVCSNSRSASL